MSRTHVVGSLPVDVSNETSFLTFLQGNLQTMINVAAQLGGGLVSPDVAAKYLDYLNRQTQQLIQVVMAREQFLGSQMTGTRAAQLRSRHRAM